MEQIDARFLWVFIVLSILVDVVKKLPWFARHPDYIPFLSVIMGLVGGALAGRALYAPPIDWSICLSAGAVVGFAAIGGYEALKKGLNILAGRT